MNGDNRMNKSGITDLITIEEMNQILINYRIGKKPLASLLGWGETTVIRYMEGDLPTREYSDKLLYILHNPGYFYEILQQNKGRLTPVAYRKCCQAVESSLLESKIKVVAQYIINKLEGHISLFELQMYLYFIQGFYLALEKEPMFEDDYIINEQNMPYKNISESFTSHGFKILPIKKDALKSKEKEFIEDLIVAQSSYGPTMLSRMLRYEIVLMNLSRDLENQKIISKQTIAKYFTGVLTSNNIISTKQIQRYILKVYATLLEAEWSI